LRSATLRYVTRRATGKPRNTTQEERNATANATQQETVNATQRPAGTQRCVTTTQCNDSTMQRADNATGEHKENATGNATNPLRCFLVALRFRCNFRSGRTFHRCVSFTSPLRQRVMLRFRCVFVQFAFAFCVSAQFLLRFRCIAFLFRCPSVALRCSYVASPLRCV
jgi:hypothetical protein